MQRLEQLVGKELFARHGRNKLLTEQGISCWAMPAKFSVLTMKPVCR